MYRFFKFELEGSKTESKFHIKSDIMLEDDDTKKIVEILLKSINKEGKYEISIDDKNFKVD